MKNKYNPKLFFIGFLMNLLRKFPILIIAAVLFIIGINNRTCTYAAYGILALSALWSLIQQLIVKFTVENNDDPDFQPFADAMMSDNWNEVIMDIVEDKIEESEETDEQE